MLRSLTGLLFNGSGGEESSKANHGKTPVDNFGFFGQTELKGRQVTVSFILSITGVLEESVTERKGAERGHQRNGEEVGVGNQDDGTFVGDSGLSRDGGESSPCLEVKEHVRIRDQSVSLAVGSGADEEPSDCMSSTRINKRALESVEQFMSEITCFALESIIINPENRTLRITYTWRGVHSTFQLGQMGPIRTWRIEEIAFPSRKLLLRKFRGIPSWNFAHCQFKQHRGEPTGPLQ